MKHIIQFQINKENSIYTAQGVDFPVTTEAANLDDLVKNIGEAVELTLENERLEDLGLAEKPSLLINFELPTLKTCRS